MVKMEHDIILMNLTNQLLLQLNLTILQSAE